MEDSFGDLCNEIASLRAYVGSNEPLVNKKLRIGKTPIDGLFDGLMKTKSGPIVLYRFLPRCFVQMNDETEYHDNAYLSCSDSFDSFINHVVGEDLACLMIRIKGTYDCVHVNEYLPDHNDEGEYILPHGHSFHVCERTLYSANEFKILLLRTGCDENPRILSDIYHIKTITLFVMDYLTLYGGSLKMILDYIE